MNSISSVITAHYLVPFGSCRVESFVAQQKLTPSLHRYLLVIEMQRLELFLPSVFCMRLLLALTRCVRTQESCILLGGEVVVCTWDPAVRE